MNLQKLSDLNENELTQMLITYDNWLIDEEKKQIYKSFKENTVIFPLNEFSPFNNHFQAEIIIKLSPLDFSSIKNEGDNWGFSVFESKEKNYFVLQSNSKLKSSLLLIIAIKSGLLQIK